MSKHTPGTWRAEQVGDTGGENPVDLYEVHNGYKRICEFASEEDARLIAASPELLEALKACLHALEYVERKAPDLGGWGVRHDRIKAARAAIAKAEEA